jgi:hypothetical protein
VSDWEVSKATAAGILADRALRRRALTGCALLLLGSFALGRWGIESWLNESLWRFLGYWLLCAGLAFFVLLFALYDLLASVREERQKGD